MTKRSHKHFSVPWAVFVIIILYPEWSYFSSLIFLLACILGSTAPDALEIKIIKHRTYTHLPVFWVFCFAVGTSLTAYYELGSIFSIIIAGVCFGALTHWAGDLGTPMGVPVFFSVKNRYSLNLWKTGHRSELVPIFVAWVLVLAFIFGKFHFREFLT